MRALGTAKSGGDDHATSSEYRFMTVPNVLTSLRIVAAPYLGHLIVAGELQWALGGVALVGFTDWLDGFIAKRYNQQSIVGKFLDPLADKVIITTLCISMGYKGMLPLELVGVILLRDLILVGGTVYYRLRTLPKHAHFFDPTTVSLEANPTLLSKANTVLQFGVLGSALLSGALDIGGFDALFRPLCLLTGATTVASGVDYIFIANGMRKRGMLAARAGRAPEKPGSRSLHTSAADAGTAARCAVRPRLRVPVALRPAP